MLRRAWIFVLTLGYSRHLWADIVFDQKSETWLGLHVRAFQELGGVPGTVVPDNLKAAVIRAAFGVDGEPVLQRSYRELGRHYGFRIEPTPPRSPEKKGKVESAVKYVKRSFWAPRELSDIRDARAQLRLWLAGVAGKRVHGTTRQQPLVLFEQEERAALAPLPLRPFELVVWKQAKVHQDGHVQVDGALYSVPWPHLGAELWVRGTPKSVTLYHEDERLATHARVGKGKRSTVEEHLPEYRRDLRHRSRSYWETRAGKIGPEALVYIGEVFDSDDVLSKLRTVQGIVAFLEKYPKERAEAASARARYFGCYALGGLKRILRQALDLQPTPEAKPRAWMKGARYARRPTPTLYSPQEAQDGDHR